MLSLAVSLVVVGLLFNSQSVQSRVAPPRSLLAVAKESATPVAQTAPRPVGVGLPARLKIPKLKIDASMDYVGLTASGDLDVPKNPANAAWYTAGPRPGENGSAVIDGHFGWKDNIPAVFDNLHTLQKGDLLEVEDRNGLTTTFVVRELRKFGSSEVAPEIFKSGDGRAHLNIITCNGSWNNAQKNYSNRLVVFTDKITQ
ncbi:MAG: peptidase family protein [Candidatus Saccharibacteria bacterium]|nr:peptidase family protein [Candidatus Saccharibacteria bacterium]